jgi:uncharacterized membrane protein
MGTQTEVLSAVYPNEEQAKTILETLEKMHRASTITLKDAALVSKAADGKIQIQETRELTTRKGAKRGAMVAGIFGLIYPPSLIASALVGAGVGAGWGKLRDTGINNSSLKSVADGLQPGQVAVVALAEEQSGAQVESTFQGFEAHLDRSSLSTEESAALDAAVTVDHPA